MNFFCGSGGVDGGRGGGSQGAAAGGQQRQLSRGLFGVPAELVAQASQCLRLGNVGEFSGKVSQAFVQQRELFDQAAQCFDLLVDPPVTALAQCIAQGLDGDVAGVDNLVDGQPRLGFAQ